jgi:hypothetical protein
MRKTFFPIILLIFIPFVNSSNIDIEVEEIMEGKITGFFFNKTVEYGLVKIKTEFTNIGSIPFNSRARMQISNKEKILYDIWTQEEELAPSERSVFEFFSFVNETGDFIIKLRIYYGGEILDYKDVAFRINQVQKTKDIFEIDRVRFSEDHIKFDIVAEDTVKDVVVIFSDAPKSWIIEQEKIDFLKKKNKEPIKVSYDPVSTSNKYLTVNLFTIDGNFLKSNRIAIKPENNIEKFFNNILDFFLSVF